MFVARASWGETAKKRSVPIKAHATIVESFPVFFGTDFNLANIMPKLKRRFTSGENRNIVCHCRDSCPWMRTYIEGIDRARVRMQIDA
jgi:hypothetical protein